MATNKINIVLEVDDKGSANVKQFEREYEKAMHKLRSSTNAATDASTSAFGRMRAGLNRVRISWVAVTAAITAFIYAAKKAIDAYLVQERAENQLANAMKLAGTYTKETHKAMIDYATSLQMTTRYGDEAVLSVMNLLQTYRLNTGELKWATRASLDFATALGIDASSAARYMGMALKGNIEMLARYIPALKSTVTEELKTMTATEKVTFFMKLMNEQFGGRAVGEMETYGAKLAWLSNLMGDLKENMVRGLLLALLNQKTAQDNAADSFRRMGQIMITTAEAITKAIFYMAQAIASVLAGFETLIIVMLKLAEYASRVQVILSKLTGSEQKQIDAKQQLVDIMTLQVSVMERLDAAGVILSKDSAEISEVFDDMRKSIQAFGKEAGDSLEDVKLSISEMNSGQKITWMSEYTDEMKKALEEYKKAQESTADRIRELSLSEFDYKMYLLDKEMQALKEAGVDKGEIARWYSLEVQNAATEEYKRQIEAQKKATESMANQFDSFATDVKTSMANILSEGIKGNQDEVLKVWDNLLDRMLDGFADKMSADFMKIIGDTISKGKIGGLFDKIGLGDLGKAFTGASTPPQLKVLDNQYNIQKQQWQTQKEILEALRVQSGQTSADGGIGGVKPPKKGGELSAGEQTYKGNYGGKAMGIYGMYQMTQQDWTGYNTSGGAMSGTMQGGQYGAAFGPYGVAVGAVAGGIIGGIGGADAEEKARHLKRAQAYMDEYNAIMEKGYNNITDMVGDFNEMLSARNIASMATLSWITQAQAEALQGWAKTMSTLKYEAENAFAVSAGSFRQMQVELGRAIDMMADDPEMQSKFIDMRDKLQETFTADIFDDFNKGLVSVEDTIQKLMRNGYDQLSAQTELLGDSYNELLILLNGSIPAIDKVNEKFTQLSDGLAELKQLVIDLPESLGETRVALYQIVVLSQHFVSAMQSLGNVMRDAEDIGQEVSNLFRAMAGGDISAVVKELYSLRDAALEAGSAMSQMYQISEYLGTMNLTAIFAALGRTFYLLSAVLSLLQIIATALKIWKEALDEVNDGWDRLAYITEKIANADIKTVISDVTREVFKMQDALDRTASGDIFVDTRNILEELYTVLEQINRLNDEGKFPNQETYQTAVDTAIAYYTQQIEDYFDAILRGIEKFSKALERDIQSLQPEGRTSADVWADIGDVKGKMGLGKGGRGFTEEMDVDEWLANAEDLRQLYWENYNIQKQKLEEERAAAEALADLYDSLADSIHDQILSLTTGGANQADIFERLGIQGTEVDRLRGLYAGETDLTKKAGYGAELASALGDYLGMAETAYGRPSAQYGAIFKDVIAELSAMEIDSRTVAEQQRDIMSSIDTQLDRIKETLITQLGSLKTATDGVGTAVKGIKVRTLSALETEGAVASALSTQVKMPIADISAKTRSQQYWFANIEWNTRSFLGALLGPKYALPKLHTGDFTVPYTGFKAELAKGEKVLTDKQYNASRSVNLNIGDINISGAGGDGKQVADALIKGLKHEITYGELGEVIRRRVA